MLTMPSQGQCDCGYSSPYQFLSSEVYLEFIRHLVKIVRYQYHKQLCVYTSTVKHSIAH